MARPTSGSRSRRSRAAPWCASGPSTTGSTSREDIMRDKPIIHPDRIIGDTAELIPGRDLGAHGPLKGILRTQGDDEGAQLLTLTIAGPPTYGSSLETDSGEPRGPLFAVVEWGIKGARSSV